MALAAEVQQRLYNEMSTAWEDLKKAQDARDEEVKKYQAESAEQKQIIERLNDKIDEIETALKSPASKENKEQDVDSEKKQIHDASLKALRYGYKLLSPEEQALIPVVGIAEAKALNLSSEASGGILAPPEIVAGILKEAVIYSDLRPLATVKQTSSKSLMVRKKSGTFRATWIREMGNKTPQGDMSFDWLEIPNHELYADVQVSEQLLEDEGIDLEAEIISDAGEQFGVTEADAFFNGTGDGQPEGLLVNPNIKSIHSALATDITADAFIDTFYDLDDIYAKSSAWYTRRANIRNIRKLKDGDGTYLWEKALVAGQPSTILGAPVVEITELPLIAAGSTPVLFGDMRRTYTIVDRINFVVKRLVETGAKQGIIEYVIRRRVGGQVMLANAMRKILIAA